MSSSLKNYSVFLMQSCPESLFHLFVSGLAAVIRKAGALGRGSRRDLQRAWGADTRRRGADERSEIKTRIPNLRYMCRTSNRTYTRPEHDLIRYRKATNDAYAGIAPETRTISRTHENA